MSNKFNTVNPTIFENEYNEYKNIQIQDIAKFEISQVVEYTRSTKLGFVIFNNEKTIFKNVAELNINIGDKVVLAYGNNANTLICIGIYETKYNNKIINYIPTFYQGTSKINVASGKNYCTESSYYTKEGNIVSFSIKVDCTDITSFGTGQFKLELPFLPIPTATNHFLGWAWVDPTSAPDELNGHIHIIADHLPNSKIIDLHWSKATTASPKPNIESTFSQGTPVTLTNDSLLYVTGTYITGEE